MIDSAVDLKWLQECLQRSRQGRQECTGVRKGKNAESKVKNEPKRSKEIKDHRDGQGQEEQGLEAPSAVR